MNEKHVHRWGPLAKVELDEHYNYGIQRCHGCLDLRVDNGIVANVYTNRAVLEEELRKS